MTPDPLLAIEARLKAATPGPWEKEIAGIKGDRFMAATGPWYSINARRDRIDEDADFIAHAPTDIATLLALVRRLREQVKAQTDGTS